MEIGDIDRTPAELIQTQKALARRTPNTSILILLGQNKNNLSSGKVEGHARGTGTHTL